jgi:hypothetical protein
MKHIGTAVVILLLSIAFTAKEARAQIKAIPLTIQQIQQVHPDTLAAGYASGNTTLKETCQYSRYHFDTVVVTGTVIAAPRISQGGMLTFALSDAFTMYIMDENGGAWSGLNVRAADTAKSTNTLITALDTGFVVKVTGIITQYFSTTQFEIGAPKSAPYLGLWNADVKVEVLDTKPRRPAPTEIHLADLVSGDPKTSIPMSQQWEGVYVVIRDLTVGTVTKNTSTGRYTWTVTDNGGNSIGVYDQSIYFRGGTGAFDPNWAPPAPGTQIQNIRGIITSSGQGIVIAPIYPGDIKLGSFPPLIRNVKRNIGIPTSTQAVTITADIEDSNTGGSIAEATLAYGTGTTTIATLPMTYNSTSKTATVDIPAQADGSVIWYYLTAKDNSNETAQYPVDIAKARPFYIVRNGSLRIRDIQYTPFSDGVPGCVGSSATVRGVVMSTADTASLGLIYIQDAVDPWSGIMVRGDANVRALVLGDDVTVSGTVAEGYSSSTNGNTLVMDAAVVTNHGKAALYPPVELTTGTFKTEVVTDGTPEAEKWEGMLLVFRNLAITNSNADAYQSKFYGEFLVNDGSGDMRVDDFGAWKQVYTNDTAKTGLIFLKAGSRLTSLTGIMFFNFANYKLEPRNVQDFSGLNDVKRISATPSAMALHPAYPNPVSKSGNGMAEVNFVLPRASEVVIELCDLLGRTVSTCARGFYPAGEFVAGIPVGDAAPGMYFVRLRAGSDSRHTALVISH